MLIRRIKIGYCEFCGKEYNWQKKPEFCTNCFYSFHKRTRIGLCDYCGKRSRDLGFMGNCENCNW